MALSRARQACLALRLRHETEGAPSIVITDLASESYLGSFVTVRLTQASDDPSQALPLVQLKAL